MFLKRRNRLCLFLAMAYMPLPDVHPNMHIPYVGYVRKPSIESDAVLLLVVEMIDYSLRYHNLHNWAPTWDLNFLRMNNPVTYFNEHFAATVISPITEEQSIQSANRLGFDLSAWLELKDREKSRNYQENCLLGIYHNNKPYLFQMFSFACYASRMALLRNQNSLVNDVAWALLFVLRKIIPYEEYYSELNFVPNVYSYQPLDVDEGIDDVIDAVKNSSENNRNQCLTPNDSILLFVKEVIDYALRYNNLDGLISSEDILIIRRNEMRYFDENIGRAVTHYCLEQDTIHAAYERGFDEDIWGELYLPSEVENFLNRFLGQLFYPDGQNMFQMLCFACYACKIAKQRNRNSLVDAVVRVLADFLHLLPYHPYYSDLKDLAISYNNHHRELHSQSDDKGVGMW